MGALVLAEAIALKTAAVDYAHPEVGVVTLDGAVCGRNYFNRLSAPEVEDEDIKEQAQMLADVRALKKAAVDYAHPEVEVVTLDSRVYGRNYFNRVSAPELEDEDIEEQAQVLADVRALKKAAVDYAHPEAGVMTSDPSVYGCNYFNRVSVPEVEDEDVEEKAMILVEAIALKKAAIDYVHPEFEVTISDPSVYSRNYFNRVSAPECEVEDIEEQAQVLVDVRALKKAAIDYAHPEMGIMMLDCTVFGRNYFNRFSAPEVVYEDIEEQGQVLADVRALKKAAVDYAHPEFEVITSD